MGDVVADLEGVSKLDILLGISLSLLPKGTFSVRFACKKWGDYNLHALKKAKASMIIGTAANHQNMLDKATNELRQK